MQIRFLTTLLFGAMAPLTAQVRVDFAPAQPWLEGSAPFTGILYPSPTLYDLDKDGKRELVIGDLPGRIVFAKRGEGVATWQKRQPLEADNAPLKLNNW